MKLKIVGILMLLALVVSIPIACNADNKTQEGGKSGIINADNPGEELDISEYLVEGKINVVDFYSDFCPPCRRVAPVLAELDKKHEGVVVLKVDINRKGVKGIDWKSPLAAQYGLRSIPHFKIFDGNGKKIAEGREANMKIGQYLNEAGIK